MNVFLKALLALIVFGVVSAIAEAICRHAGIDAFWGWLIGVVAGFWFFFGYDTPQRRV